MNERPGINIGEKSMGSIHAPGQHYVYQRIHVLKGKALHLSDHLRIVSRAFEQIYGYDPKLDEREMGASIVRYMQILRPPAHTGSTVMLCIAPQGDDDRDIAVEYERPLLEAGYSHSPLRPRAAAYEYSIPFPALPTNFQIEARSLFDTLALRQHGATRSIRRNGDHLLSCGDAPLFAIRGHTLLTPPPGEGAMNGVERELVIAAAPKAHLTTREEPILHPELKSYDELFFADASGITSLSECDGAKFMSLVAPRLAAALKS